MASFTSRTTIIPYVLATLVSFLYGSQYIHAQSTCTRSINPADNIQTAVNQLTPGQTLCLNAGTYNQAFTVANLGTSSNRITIRANGQVVLTGSPNVPEIITITGDFITIDGFTLRHEHRVSLNNSVYWILTSASANGTIIRNNRLVLAPKYTSLSPTQTNNYRDKGIGVVGSDNTEISSNYVEGVDQGIFSRDLGGKKLVIRKNHTFKTWASGLHIGSPGAPQIQHILVEDNLFEYSLTEDGIQFTQNFNASDPATDISNLGAIVRNNVFKDNSENAIDLKGAGDIVIDNNIIYGTDGDNDGFFLCGCLCASGGNDRCSMNAIGRGSRTQSGNVIIRRNIIYDNPGGIKHRNGNQNWVIYHNTIINNNHDFSGSNSSWADPSNDTFTGIRGDTTSGIFIKNNIIAQHNHREISFTSVGGRYEVDNNLYWHTGTPQFGTNHQETNRRIAKPLFINIPASFRPTGDHSQYDFHLLNSSNNPALNTGVPLTKTRSAGSGQQIPVSNALYFSDGNGSISGDIVQIGSSTATITGINLETNTLTVNRSLTWNANAGVTLPYVGAAPDMGAYESGATDPNLTSTPTPTTPTALTATPTSPASTATISIEAESGNIITPFVINGTHIVHTTNPTNPNQNGQATYTFNVVNPGTYKMIMTVDAPNTAADSLFVNIDAQPTDPQMTWDIIPLTQGFADRTVSWRGSGTFDNNEFNPKLFALNSGNHSLIIVGRESGVKIDKIHLEKVTSPIPQWKLFLSRWFTNQLDNNSDSVFNIIDWLDIFN